MYTASFQQIVVAELQQLQDDKPCLHCWRYRTTSTASAPIKSKNLADVVMLSRKLSGLKWE
jgi:hypothetical protein